MKILVITPYFYPVTGGSQRYIQELYSQLLKDHPEVRVDVLTYNTEKIEKYSEYGKIRVYRVGCVELLKGQFALPNYFDLMRTLRKLKKNKYDLVNSHTRFFDNSWWTPWVAKYFGSKSLLTDHCASHPNHLNGVVRHIARTIDKIVIPRLSKSYDRVSVVSRETGRFLKSMGLENYDVFYGGINVGEFRQKRKGYIKGVGKIGKDEVVITYAGRMIPSKNPDLLFRVAEKIVKLNKKVRFVFAGDGPMLSKLKSKSLERVSFLGKLGKEEVISLLTETDIFVYPSEHHEGFPIALLEAGAGGCVVVASDIGGVKELIENNQNGLMIKPREDKLFESIRILLKNKALRKEWGGKLKSKIEKNFDWENISEDYFKYLKKMIDS
jgi:glycosyltransferase involved in cell wall biosynthesis